MMNYAAAQGRLPADVRDRPHSHAIARQPVRRQGSGRSGTIASTAAVANAVIDALSPFGISHLDMPLTPSKIWSAIHSAGEGN